MSLNSYSKLPATLWEDLQPLSPETQRFAFYVLTTPHRTTEGLFRLRPAYAADDTGLDLGDVQKHLETLAAAGFIELDTEHDVVLIVDALKWDSPRSPNNVKHAIRQLKTLPSTPLMARLHELATDLCPALANAISTEFELGRQPSPKPSPEPSSNGVPHSPSPSPSPSPTSREVEASDDARQLASRHAELAHTNNGTDQAWLTGMQALLNDGHTPERIRELLAYAFSDDFWSSRVPTPAALRRNWQTISQRCPHVETSDDYLTRRGITR